MVEFGSTWRCIKYFMPLLYRDFFKMQFSYGRRCPKTGSSTISTTLRHTATFSVLVYSFVITQAKEKNHKSVAIY